MRTFLLASAVAGAASLFVLPANANPINFGIFDNTNYFQTSDSAPAAPFQYFLDLTADEAAAGDFDQASASYPGLGSPQSLPSTPPTSFIFGSPLFSSLSDLHVAYPFGSYTFTASNSVPPNAATGTIAFTADYFTGDVPYLTNYSALSGLNPAAAFTITFPSYTPNSNPDINEAFTFLDIYDEVTGAAVAGIDFQSPGTTSYTIPANTLQANHPYLFELNYDNRIAAGLVGNAYTQQGFDMRTDGVFTTGAAAVPEPATLALLAVGLLGLGLARRRTNG